MHKKFPLLLLLAALLVSFTFQTTLKTLNGSLYTLKYPSTWECVRDSGMIDYYIYPPEDNDRTFNENIVVRHTDMAGNKTTFDEFAKHSRDGIKELFKDVVFISDKDVTGKTGKYHEFVYTGKYNGTLMKMKQLFYLQYGYSYILIYTAKASTFDTNIKEADGIMQSFKPKPPKK